MKQKPLWNIWLTENLIQDPDYFLEYSNIFLLLFRKFKASTHTKITF